MPEIGQNLSHYTIVEKIGKGGMGEVFRARDQKLGRDVAIKVLPVEFAKDPDRVARFQREAKLLASLNHPGIAAIHGLDESGGISFLVLELVEGETLADRLKHGAVPVEESLKLALQIAEALEAAHEKSVIHRDLKPANIKVTPDDKVKVLDFGLAKAYAGNQEVNLSNSPTLSDAATRQGVILGTAAYMSPEQARGKSVDKRADIWAFGCVLYEMLTGQAAFQGEDITEILAAVVKGGANLDLLPANLHPRVQEAITRCLQKDLGRRYKDVSEAKYEIEQVLADPGGVFVQPSRAAKSKMRRRLSLPWVAALAILCLIAGGTLIWHLKPAEPPQVVRFDYGLPEGHGFNNINLALLAVSSDGKQFVYSTSEGLWLRSLGEYQAKLISGTEPNPSTPFFSPDGRWIGYWSSADGKLKKVALSGGAPVVLCDANILVGASWSADDTIVYGEVGKGIMRVSANGGAPELIAKLTGMYMVKPQILPGGKAVLFALVTAEKSQIIVQSLESGEQKVLIEGDSPQYLPTGHLVYMAGHNLYAVPFDLDKLKITGGPVSLIGDIFRVGRDNAPQFAVSDSGVLVYMPGMAGAVSSVQRTLAWVNRKGIEEPIAAIPNSYSAPKVSPDGKRLALSVDANGNGDIWIYDLNRDTSTRLTFDEGNENYPLWTLDGKAIVYVSGNVTRSTVYRKAADGTGKEERLGPPPGTAAFAMVLVKRWENLDGNGIQYRQGAERGY